VSISVSGNVNSGNIVNTGLISSTGNVTGNYIFGNGSQLTGVSTGASSNVSNGTSNVTVVSSGGNVSVGIGGTGNVAVFATTGEYVTGIVSATGTVTGSSLLGSVVSVSGAVTAASVVGGIITGTSVSLSGNTTPGNVLTSGVVSATGNITGGNISATNHTGTTVSVTGNITGGNISATNHTGTTVSVTGNITGGNISATNHTGTTVSVTGNITGGNISATNGVQSGTATDAFAKFNYDGGAAALNITNEYNSGGAGSTYGQIVFKNYNSSGGSLTERARITGSGNFLAQKCISVGGATPSSDGAGITFPGTASPSSNANTLDDYEEGTWAATDGSGAGLGSFGTGNYTRIGNFVFVQIYATWPVTANTNNASIAGLPFTSLGTYFTGAVSSSGGGSPIICRISGGTSIGIFAAGNNNITNANLSNSYVLLSMGYLI
jgi:hypothetical protein